MLQSIKVSEVMSRKLVTAGEEETLSQVAEKMLKARVGSVVIVSDRRVVGIVTEKDFVKFFASRLSPDESVKHHMTRNVITVNETTSINDAKNIMVSQKIRHVPVVNQHGELVGMVTVRDLVECIETLI